MNDKNFNELYVWIGSSLGCSEIEFKNVMFSFLGLRIKFCESVRTNGRTDLLFYIHDEDIQKLDKTQFKTCIKRLDDIICSNKLYFNSSTVTKYKHLSYR